MGACSQRLVGLEHVPWTWWVHHGGTRASKAGAQQPVWEQAQVLQQLKATAASQAVGCGFCHVLPEQHQAGGLQTFTTVSSRRPSFPSKAQQCSSVEGWVDHTSRAHHMAVPISATISGGPAVLWIHLSTGGKATPA